MEDTTRGRVREGPAYVSLLAPVPLRMNGRGSDGEPAEPIFLYWALHIIREATYNALGMCSPHPGPLSPDSQAEAWLSSSTEIDAYHGRLLACCDSHLDIHSLQSTPVPHCNSLCLFSQPLPRALLYGIRLHHSCLSRLVGWTRLAGSFSVLFNRLLAPGLCGWNTACHCRRVWHRWH